MACASPQQLDDKALLRYLDGEADPTVVAHLKQCLECRGRAEQLSREQHQLKAQLYRMACPDPATLGEYCLGLLPRDRDAVARHLNECPRCRAEVSQLMAYLAELAPELEISPLERVKIWVARLISGAEASAPGRTTLAPAYAGVRGAEAHPFLYQAGEAQIAIEIQDDVEQPDRKMLLGLALGLPAGMTAHLWQADRRIAAVPLDELGNFVIPGLTPGRYELILSGAEVEIHVQAVQVGVT